MNITKHFKKRYVQRITGLTNDNEIGQYVAQNEAQIIENISKMIEYSKFLYKGKVGKNNNLSNFYIVDNIILVTDQNNNFITLYRIDFNFPEEINRQVMKGLLSEIESLQEKLTNVNNGIEEFSQQKSVEIENVDIEIQILQKQIEIKKSQKKILEDEVKNKRNESEFVNKEIEKYVNMLCNSLEYKKAMMELNLD
jgi:hypothetical protein